MGSVQELLISNIQNKISNYSVPMQAFKYNIRPVLSVEA